MAGINTVDRRIALDRRSGIERRRTEDGHQQFARASGSPAIAIVDRRQAERRGPERRAIAARTGTAPPPRTSEPADNALRADRADSAEPQLACPVCRGRLEYEVRLSWISPAAYTVDTGYCPSCSRRFLRTRNTDGYDSMSWAPLCRVCREPVAFMRALNDRRMTVYHCPAHPGAVWEYDMVTDRWAVRS